MLPADKMFQNTLIGIDVGGTKIAAALIDRQGNVLASLRRPTIIGNPDLTLDGIAETIQELVQTNDLNLKDIGAIGFGIPGLVDAENGIGIALVNLSWENVPVRAGLQSSLGVRCIIENDVKTGAIGEARFGAGRGHKDIIYLNIGTGISATIILNGKLFNGVHGLAGEIGHAIQEPGGPPCKCGGAGCLEAVASGPGMAARALEKIRSLPAYSDNPPETCGVLGAAALLL